MGLPISLFVRLLL